MSALFPHVYLNGEWVAADEARISVLDRGFLFGDGVYEVIPVYQGVAFRIEEHLQRLQRSLDAIQIANPLPLSRWLELVCQLIEENGKGDQSVYLQVTRGVMEKREHIYSQGLTPTTLLMSQPTHFPEQDPQTSGIKAITLDDIRWEYCQIKSTTLLANVMLKQQAHDYQASEAILIRDGKAIEGSASNLFIVSDGIIMTPPQSNRLLGGITRDLVLELSREHKLLYRECDIPEALLHEADEVWITSSNREVAPVTTLNQHAVGRGKPGPVWQTMIGLYHDCKQQLLESA